MAFPAATAFWRSWIKVLWYESCQDKSTGDRRCVWCRLPIDIDSPLQQYFCECVE